MRLPKRYEQSIYVANETYFGSGEYVAPVKVRGIVSPKAHTLIIGGGITQEQNSSIITIETRVPEVKDITSNSHIWIKKVPVIGQAGADYTHAVVSRDSDATGFYAMIEIRSVAGNTPIV